MHIMVPGRGHACTFQVEGVGYQEGVLGPLADGDYVRRFTYQLTCEGVLNCVFGASIGASNEATIQAFANGTSIIQRGETPGYGQPVCFVQGAAGSQHFGWLPVGIVGAGGARYVIVHLQVLTIDLSVHAAFGIEVLRLRSVVDVMPPEG